MEKVLIEIAPGEPLRELPLNRQGVILNPIQSFSERLGSNTLVIPATGIIFRCFAIRGKGCTMTGRDEYSLLRG